MNNGDSNNSNRLSFPLKSSSDHHHGIRDRVGRDGRGFGTAMPREILAGPAGFHPPQGASRGEGLAGWGLGRTMSGKKTRWQFAPLLSSSSPRHTLGLLGGMGLDKQACPLRNHTTELERSHHAPCQPRLLSPGPDILPTFPESTAF